MSCVYVGIGAATIGAIVGLFVTSLLAAAGRGSDIERLQEQDRLIARQQATIEELQRQLRGVNGY